MDNEKLGEAEIPPFLQNEPKKHLPLIPPFLSAIQYRKTQSGIEIPEDKMKIAWKNWVADHQKLLELDLEAV